MPKVARIYLASTNVKDLEEVTREIKSVADDLNARLSGPIPLPTRRLKVVVRKTPCGDGTHTFDRWELRIHKRIIDIVASETVLRRIARIKIPPTVKISINLK